MTTPRAGDLAALPLTISLFSNEKDNVPVRQDTTWGDFVERLSHHDVRLHKEGPGFSPVLYRQGATRGKEGVERLYCAVADVDSGITPQQFLEQFPSDLEVLIVSTHRSSPEKPKFRAITPLATPCPGREWEELWQRLQHHVWHGASDKYTKDASRFFFLPSHPPEGTPFVLHQPGRALDWEALPPVPGLPRSDGGSGGRSDSLENWTPMNLDAIVTGVEEGGRNDTAYRYASRLRGKRYDVEDAEIALLGFASRCNPPMDEAEVRAIVRSVWKRYPAGERAVAVGRFEEGDDADGSPESREPYQFVDASELDDEPDFDWIVPGILAPNLVTILGGQAKDGKSTWMASMIGAIQRGDPFMDLQTTQVDGVILLTEEPAASLREKRDRFGWQAGRTSIMHRGTVGTRPDIATAIDRALARAEETGANVLIVDSLMYWGGVTDSGGENDSATMQQVMNELVHAAGRGLAVLVVHHSSKDGEALRGSGAIAANVDIILTLKHTQGGGGARRRLNGVGRSDKVPQNVTIELEGSEYRVVGAQGETLSERRRRLVQTTIFSADQPLSIDHLLDDWPLNEKAPTPQALSNTLRNLVDAELVAQIGKGVRGDPYTYAMSTRARAMVESVVKLLESCTTHRPDAQEIAARLGLEVVDVQAVLGAIAAENHAAELAVREGVNVGLTISPLDAVSEAEAIVTASADGHDRAVSEPHPVDDWSLNPPF